MRRSLQRLVCRSCLAAWIGAALSCSDDDSKTAPLEEKDAGARDAAASTSRRDAAAQLSDAEIVAVLRVVNASEIDAGNLALMRARHAPTRTFAQAMVAMHTTAQQRQAALATSLDLAPTESAIGTRLREQARTMQTELMDVSDSDFDRLYAHAQVTAHMNALTLIDDILLPTAGEAMLRAELRTTRAAVADHLAMATALVETAEALDAGL